MDDVQDLTTEAMPEEPMPPQIDPTRGLKAKRDELLAEVRHLKDRLAEAQEDTETLRQEALRLTEKLEATQADRDAVQTELDAMRAARSQALAEAALATALADVNVHPLLRDAALALILARHVVAVSDDADDPAAVLLDEKPVAQVVAAWSQGDEGRHFIAAPHNGGAAAPPSGSSRGRPTPRRNAMTVNDKAAYIAAHGVRAFLALPA